MKNRSFLHLGQSPIVTARRASTLLEEEEEATSMGSAQVALSMPLGELSVLYKEVAKTKKNVVYEPNSSQYLGKL